MHRKKEYDGGTKAISPSSKTTKDDYMKPMYQTSGRVDKTSYEISEAFRIDKLPTAINNYLEKNPSTG